MQTKDEPIADLDEFLLQSKSKVEHKDLLNHEVAIG